MKEESQLRVRTEFAKARLLRSQGRAVARPLSFLRRDKLGRRHWVKGETVP